MIIAVFDATGTIRAVAAQANLLDKDGQIINGRRELITVFLSSLFTGLVGASPAAVYIESAAGTMADGKTGLTAIVVGLLFLLMLFMSLLAWLVPTCANVPADVEQCRENRFQRLRGCHVWLGHSGIYRADLHYAGFWRAGYRSRFCRGVAQA